MTPRQTYYATRAEEGQPMPAEAWSDHPDANEQFNSADREAFPWIVAAVVAFAFLCALALSQVDWSSHVPA